MLIDTHAHLNFNAYKNDFRDIIGRSLDNDIWMINVGSQYETSKRAVEMTENYNKGVYAAIGLHPIHLTSGIFKMKMDKEESAFNKREEGFDVRKYRELVKNKTKVVAIGEIGLDYYYKPKTKIKLKTFKNIQKDVFLEQINLAKELDLPIIFHCRMAHDEMIEIIENEKNLRGIIHCFTGNWEQAKRYIEMGFCLGFNGIIFKLDLDNIIKKSPLDKIVIETDCPYLTPPQELGRNEPVYVKHIADKIATLRKIGIEEISEITTENAKKLFGI
ncbi:TatD family hydrolase [Patescibacteria group bacterium]